MSVESFPFKVMDSVKNSQNRMYVVHLYNAFLRVAEANAGLTSNHVCIPCVLQCMEATVCACVLSKPSSHRLHFLKKTLRDQFNR